MIIYNIEYVKSAGWINVPGARSDLNKYEINSEMTKFYQIPLRRAARRKKYGSNLKFQVAASYRPPPALLNFQYLFKCEASWFKNFS